MSHIIQQISNHPVLNKDRAIRVKQIQGIDFDIHWARVIWEEVFLDSEGNPIMDETVANRVIVSDIDNTNVGAVKYNGTTVTAGNFYGGNSTPTSVAQRLNFDGILAATRLEIFGTGSFTGKLSSDGDIEGVEFYSASATQTGIVNNATFSMTLNPDRVSILSVRNTGTVNCFAVVIASNINGTITFSTLISANVTVTSGANQINFQNSSGGTVAFAHRRLDLNN